MLEIWSQIFVFNFFFIILHCRVLTFDEELKILTNNPLVLDLNPPLSSFQSSAENWRTLILDLMYAAGSY